MDAAPIRLAMTSVLAALLVSFAPTFGNPIVKFVVPVKDKANEKVESIPRPKPVSSPKPVLIPKSYNASTPSVTKQPQGLVKLVSKANRSLPQEQAVQANLDTGPSEVAAPVQPTVSQAQAVAKLIDTRSKQQRFQPSSTATATYITRPTKVPLSAFFKTKPDAPSSSSIQIVDQPSNSLDPEPVVAVTKPRESEARSEDATAAAETTVKTRIQHVARPSAIKKIAIAQNAAPQNPPSKSPTPTLVSGRKRKEFDSLVPPSTPQQTAPSVSKVVHASSDPAAIPETVNSELVERIIGRPSLIAFVSAQPAAFTDDHDTGQISSNASADEDDGYEDGQPAIDRVTVNVRPTEGELPPDHASAKFAKNGEVIQRMGASRHWMMYEFNWEASALKTRPVYFEDINLERYGYSHGLLLEPIYSAGHFFLRVPFIPYMRGANPPFRQVYTLGYGRPGSYFPYYLHRPPVSVRGALQEAAWAVGLVFILP